MTPQAPRSRPGAGTDISVSTDMSTLARRHRRSLAIIALALMAGCVVATWWQIERALAGNALSNFYAAMWPLYAGYIVYAWRRLRTASAREAGNAGGWQRALADDDDPELAEYNRFLAARKATVVHGIRRKHRQ